MELARTLLIFLSIPFVAALLAAPAALLYWLGTFLYRFFPSPYFAVYLVVLAYLGFTPLLMLEAVLLKRIFRLRIREGSYNLRDLSALPWALVTLLVQLVRYVGNLGLYRSTPFLVWYMRGMGAKVGKSVIVNTVKVYDMDLLEIGDRVTIGGDVVLIAHSGERNRLLLKRVTIGRGADIGHSTTILCGAKIGENARIGAMSIVPKDAVIPPHTCWGGVPLRQISDEQPEPEPPQARPTDA